MKKKYNIFKGFDRCKEPNKDIIGATILFDVITELETVKGAMILEGYEPEDSCVKYVEDTIDNFKNKYRELNNFPI